MVKYKPHEILALTQFASVLVLECDVCGKFYHMYYMETRQWEANHLSGTPCLPCAEKAVGSPIESVDIHRVGWDALTPKLISAAHGILAPLRNSRQVFDTFGEAVDAIIDIIKARANQ